MPAVSPNYILCIFPRHLGRSETSKIDLFAKMITAFQRLSFANVLNTLFERSSRKKVCQGKFLLPTQNFVILTLQNISLPVIQVFRIESFSSLFILLILFTSTSISIF